MNIIKPKPVINGLLLRLWHAAEEGRIKTVNPIFDISGYSIDCFSVDPYRQFGVAFNLNEAYMVFRYIDEEFWGLVEVTK